MSTPFGLSGQSSGLSCEAFCTKAECADLQAQIQALRDELYILQTAFAFHLSLPIPYSHSYQPDVKVNVNCGGAGTSIGLNIDVTVDGAVSSDSCGWQLTEWCTVEKCEELEQKINEHTQAPISTAHNIDSELGVDVSVAASEEGQFAFFTRVDFLGKSGNDREEVKVDFPDPDLTDYCTKGECEEIKNDLTALKNDVDVLGGKVDEIENDVTVLGGDVTTVKNDVDVLGGKVDEIEKKTDAIANEQTQTTIVIEQKINEKVPTIDDIIDQINWDFKREGQQICLSIRGLEKCVEVEEKQHILDHKLLLNGDTLISTIFFDGLPYQGEIMICTDDTQQILRNQESILDKISGILIPKADATIATGEEIKELERIRDVSAVERDRELKEDIKAVDDKVTPLDEIIKKIYAVLGGDNLYNGLTHNPENDTKTKVATVYDGPLQPFSVESKTILDLFLNYSIYWSYRQGLTDLPAEVPSTLISKDDAAVIQEHPESLLEFNAWSFKMIESILGKFPIEITIKKDHPINERKLTIKLASVDPNTPPSEQTIAPDQDTEIEIENIAETLAELLGQHTATHTHLLTLNKMISILLGELASTRKTVIHNSEELLYLKAALGFPFKEEKSSYDSSFNPISESTDLDDIFTPSKIEYVKDVFTEPKNTLNIKLNNLLFTARIIQAVYWQKLTNRDIVGSFKESIKDFAKVWKDGVEEDRDNWKIFLDDMETGFNLNLTTDDDTKPYGRDWENRPKVIEKYEDEG